MDFIWPMLFEKSEPFTAENFIFENKFDGIRFELIHSRTGGLSFYTRHKTKCTQFPELQSIKNQLNEDLILDGELIVFDQEKGKESWEKVMDRFLLKDENKIKYASRFNPVIYVVFDILYYKKSLLNLPLIERKEILSNVINDDESIQKIMFIENEGELYFNKVKELQLEGAVAKRKDSLYRPGIRVNEWRKILNLEHYEVLIRGFKKKEFGLLASFVEDGMTRAAGVIEFATPELRKEFFRRAYKQIKSEDTLNVYLREGINGRVSTRELTRNGMLRTPVLTEIY